MPGGWPAVVYPALSPGGTITYVQARYLDPPAGRDKYDNPARSHATNPRVAWLHAVDPAHRGVLVVTEGVADGLVAAQAGFPTVGVLGSQYPDRRVVDAITATMERSPQLAGATGGGVFRRRHIRPGRRRSAVRSVRRARCAPSSGVTARRARPHRMGGRRPVRLGGRVRHAACRSDVVPDRPGAASVADAGVGDRIAGAGVSGEGTVGPDIPRAAVAVRRRRRRQRQPTVRAWRWC